MSSALAKQERITALSLGVRPGEVISIDGPTQVKLLHSSSGRAQLVFIGPESTQINRRGYTKPEQKTNETMEDALARKKLSAASVRS